MSLLTIAIIASIWLLLLIAVVYLCRSASRAEQAQHTRTSVDARPTSGSSTGEHPTR